jgi:hypothetical protein
MWLVMTGEAIGVVYAVGTIVRQKVAGKSPTPWLFILRILIQFMNSLNVRVHGNTIEHM